MMAVLRFKGADGEWHRIPARGPKGNTGNTGAQGLPGPNLIDEQTQTLVNGLLMGEGGTVRAAIPGVDYAAAGSAVEMRLLWENASPTSAFPAQTINVNLEAYDGALLVTRGWVTRDIRLQTMARKGTSIKVPGYDVIFCCRDVTVNASGIQFGPPLVALTYNSTLTERTQNDGCIPIAIYGLQGVTA